MKILKAIKLHELELWIQCLLFYRKYFMEAYIDNL